MPRYPLADWKPRPGWSEFGAARNSNLTGVKRKHAGYDLYAQEGVPIFATGPGVVVARLVPSAGHGYGYAVSIRYDDGVTIRYAHMPQASGLGMLRRVEVGQLIGYVGHTGNAAKIVWNGLRHLHVEATRNGKLIDPRAYFASLADANTKPAQPEEPEEEEDEMNHLRLIRDSRPREKDIYLVNMNTGKETHLSEEEWKLLVRMLKNTGSIEERMEPGQREACYGAIRRTLL